MIAAETRLPVMREAITGKVLIVDDEHNSRLLVQHILHDSGLQLEFATHVHEAMRIAEHFRPDLILSDVMMPRANGYDLCRQVRLHPALAEVPIILITCLNDRIDKLSGLEAGADDFITKPFDQVELKARVQAVLRLGRYQRLLQERRNFEKLFHLSPVPTCVVNEDTEIVEANAGLTQLLCGKDGTCVDGRRLDSFLKPGDRNLLKQLISEVIRGQETRFLVETDFIKVDTRTATVEIHAGPYQTPAGPRAQMVLLDLSERRSSEARLLRAQRLESIGALASGVAHDMNNILSPIQMCGELIERLGPINSRQAQATAMISKSVERGRDLIKQILTFARGDQAGETRQDPRILLKELYRVIRQTFPKNINCEIDYPGDALWFLGDGSNLYQVLLNLCINARDAMPEGGSIRMKVSTQIFQEGERTPVRDGTVQAGEYVVFEVEDTGPGIPQALREKVFEPFFTTKPKDLGTGLGLATSVDIIHKHKGFMLLDSAPESGTRFSVAIPAVPPKTQAPKPPVARELQGNGEWILIVDDESFVRETFRLNLESRNYRVISVSTGSEAFAEAARHMDIALVISDLHMPELDGYTVTSTLKKLIPNAAVLGVSGHATDDEIRRWKTAGASRVLPKPLSSRELLEAVHQAINPNTRVDE